MDEDAKNANENSPDKDKEIVVGFRSFFLGVKSYLTVAILVGGLVAIVWIIAYSPIGPAMLNIFAQREETNLS